MSAVPAPVLVNFDSDGDLDLVAKRIGGATAFFENQGPGATLGQVASGPSLAQPRLLGAAQLTGSGAWDVWISGDAAAHSHLFASGRFEPQVLITTGSGPVNDLVAVDWDGDRTLEFFGAIEFASGRRTQIFEPVPGPCLPSMPGPSLLPRPFENPALLVDVDQDGREDIVIAEGDVFAVTSSIVWARNIGAGLGFVDIETLAPLDLS